MPPRKTLRPPSIETPVEFAGRPIVAGVAPGLDPVVVLTAASLARTVGVRLVCAYVDQQRVVTTEHDDGTVDHEPLDADLADDAWLAIEAGLRQELAPLLDPAGPTWELVYLAGLPWRALTHLARAIDASMFVIGAQRGHHRSPHLFFDSSISARLSYHQHRPVMVVPLDPVDWAARTPWQ